MIVFEAKLLVMVVLLQVLGIYIYSVIVEDGALRHGTADLYCEDILFRGQNIVLLRRNLSQ